MKLDGIAHFDGKQIKSFQDVLNFTHLLFFNFLLINEGNGGSWLGRIVIVAIGVREKLKVFPPFRFAFHFTQTIFLLMTWKSNNFFSLAVPPTTATATDRSSNNLSHMIISGFYLLMSVCSWLLLQSCLLLCRVFYHSVEKFKHFSFFRD